MSQAKRAEPVVSRRRPWDPEHSGAEPTCPGPYPALTMTLAASSQRSQIIRSKFRSALQLRIHRRNQDSTSGPPLALPSGPTPFFCSPEPHLGLRSSLNESPSISEGRREPPEQRQGARADPQARGSALVSPGPEGTSSQHPHPRMKPTPHTPSPPGVPNPWPPSHKLELQTLKLEELTVSELRQQLRLRGLPVSGTKSMLLERMRGGAPPRERPKPRREDSAPWPRLRPKTLGTARRKGPVKPSTLSLGSPLPRAAHVPVSTPAPAPAPAPARAAPSAPASAALTLEEELQAAIRSAELLPNRGIDDILDDQEGPDDPLPPIPLDFPGSFDLLSPSSDSEGLSSVFSSSLPSPANSPFRSPRSPTDSLDWLETLSGGPPLGSGPPAPSIFSADLSDSSGTWLWDLLEDPW